MVIAHKIPQIDYETALKLYNDPAAEAFIYDDLPFGGTTRVLCLILGPEDGVLFATLSTIDLFYQDRPSVPYNALSYAWGDTATQHSIICISENKWQRVQITKNLYTILCHIRNLSHGTVASEALWVDAISINQVRDEHGLKERADQIELMKFVFSRASVVLIYLASLPTEQLNAFSNFTRMVADNLEAFTDDIESRTIPPNVLADMWDENLTAAVFKISSGEWVTRLWTYQEFILAQKPVYMINDRTWGGEMFLIVRALFKYGAVQGFIGPTFTGERIQLLSWYEQFFLYFKARMRFDEQQKQFTARELLVSTFQAETTDPRDKLYALYGLIPDEGWGNADPIKVDCAKSIEILSIEASSLLLVEDEYTLSLFRLFSGPDSRIRSWAIDLDRSKRYRWMPKFSLLSDHWHECLFNACGDTKLDVRLVTENNFLLISGAVVDSVECEGPMLTDPRGISSDEWRDPNFFIQMVLHELEATEAWIGPLFPHLQDDEKFEMKWRTLCCDLQTRTSRVMRATDHNGYDYRCFLTCMADHFGKQFHDQVTNDSESNLVDRNIQWCAIQFDVCNGRKLASTRCDRLGAFPPETIAGDQIVQFSGVPVPFVTRKQKDGSYKFVGECYLHGAMDGQLVKDDVWKPESMFIS